MANLRQLRSLTFGLSAGALALAIVFVLTVVTSPAAQAQTYKVIHTFTGAGDGGNPYAGVTYKSGSLYGTTYYYGTHDYGVVYQLKLKNGNWTVNPLYSFTGGKDGAYPRARVIFGPDGTLYGTAEVGGSSNVGTVFNLRPSASAPKTALAPWLETVLYSFKGGANDGGYPQLGDLLFDKGGNIYGTTIYGGNSNCQNGCGSVYELVPPSGGGGWTEKVLYLFSANDGAYPWNRLIFDQAGNLYSTTEYGGLGNFGTAFELTFPGPTEIVINTWVNEHGDYPIAGLVFDASGNLYGATSDGGTGGGGTVFELTPLGNNNWQYTLLYSFTGTAGHNCGPWGTLVIDVAGNLYGTTVCDGPNKFGSVFKLTPSSPYWTLTDLYDFTGGNDGKYPYSTVEFDPNGNLYGTAYGGGSNTVGVVWEITFP